MIANDWLTSGRLKDGVIVIGFGGNIGGLKALQLRFLSVIGALSEDWGLFRMSRLYSTAPVGEVVDQPIFLNAVCAWRPPAPVSPESALCVLQRLERRHDRIRDVVGGARTLDLDLLLHGQLTCSGRELVVPHPRMSTRAFVLRPLYDLFGGDFIWSHQDATLADYLAEATVRSQAIEVWS